MACEEVLKGDRTLLVEKLWKIFQEQSGRFKNKRKVKPVKSVCGTRAHDCGGSWREVKQKWLAGALDGVIRPLECILQALRSH